MTAAAKQIQVDVQASRPDDAGAEELVAYLERDQLSHDRSKPVARAELSTPTSVALWTLRIFVFVVGAMVVYTFFAQLGTTP